MVRTQSRKTNCSLLKGSVARNEFIALCLQKVVRVLVYGCHLDFRIFT